MAGVIETLATCTDVSSELSEEDENTSEVDEDADKKLKVTLASNSKGWDKMINRAIVKELAHNWRIKLSGFVPHHTEQQREHARELNIELFDAKSIPGYYSETELLAYPPDDMKIDVLIMHSYECDVGKQAQIIKENKNCIWAVVVHTISNELEEHLNKTQSSNQAVTQLTEHELQLTLCQKADLVIAVGPKVAEAYKTALIPSGKQDNVFTLTPGISEDYLGVNEHYAARETFRVLISGSAKYFKVKGCDIAAKAITLLQDLSCHLIFIVQHDDDIAELSEAMQSEGISSNQLKVQPCSAGDSERWIGHLYRDIDLLIKPSRTEGFGMSGLRAISANVPILISGNTGLGMTLKTVTNGADFVVDSDDPQVWADKIREFRCEEPKARRSKVAKLKLEYMKQYQWKGQCDTLVEAFLDMCNVHA